jgi:epoxyqueuosine reductase
MISSGDKDLSRKIKDFAISIGFDLVGIAPLKQLNEHKEVLQKWLAAGMNAGMGFISRDVEKRTNPALLLDGGKSVVVAGLNYFPSEKQGGDGIPVISKYAYGKDYHAVLSKKLKCLLEYIISCEPTISGVVCADSAPVLEKAWAREAGLGWIGKNSILINQEIGSFIFLGELILNIELQYDKLFSNDFCGNCRLCVESCPTGAINENKTIDARKCISWLTVENKNAIPEDYKAKIGGRVFGCDLCQDVCPWNKNAQSHNNAEFKLTDQVKNMSAEDWKSLSFDYFNKIFEKSSVKRATYSRFIRNVNFVLSGNRLL